MPVFVAMLAIAGWGGESGGGSSAMLRFGGDPARGVLVNLSPGARPFDPPDPNRPTVVFVHGINPMPRVVHFEMARRLAEALAFRPGPCFSVFGWDWNAATVEGTRREVNDANAVAQGVVLAGALRASGVDPVRIHLIGHSSGAMVATSAARSLADAAGRPIAQLTLLEAASCHHDMLYQRLGAATAALRVENYWSPGVSGFGRETLIPGVQNIRVPGQTPVVGVVWPLRSNHISIVRWYVQTAADPTCPDGFNTSLLLQAGP